MHLFKYKNKNDEQEEKVEQENGKSKVWSMEEKIGWEAYSLEFRV